MQLPRKSRNFETKECLTLFDRFHSLLLYAQIRQLGRIGRDSSMTRTSHTQSDTKWTSSIFFFNGKTRESFDDNLIDGKSNRGFRGYALPRT